MSLLHSEITGKILGSYYEIFNALGYGLPVEMYKKGMVVKLKSEGLKVEEDGVYKVYMLEEELGEVRVDIIVEEKVLIKVLSEKKLSKRLEKGLETELRKSRIEVGLLLNFGIRPEYKRRVWTGSR